MCGSDGGADVEADFHPSLWIRRAPSDFSPELLSIWVWNREHLQPKSPELSPGFVLSFLATPTCTAAGVTFQAGAVADHGEIAAFRAVFALITLHAGHGDLLGLVFFRFGFTD